MNTKNKIQGGIYLVIDPSVPLDLLLQKLSIVLLEGICAVQIWDHFNNGSDIDEIISSVCILCKQHNTPVLINNQWKWLNRFDFDGVHFDELPNNFSFIKQQIGRDFICGITCNNNISVVEKANNEHVDYISFCSMFPSTTSNSCELVSFEIVRKVSAITKMPIFLAGGIKLENIDQLQTLPYNGIVVISGIMNAADPKEITKQYLQKIKPTHDNRNN